MQIRPMRRDDVAYAERLCDGELPSVDPRPATTGEPDPETPLPERRPIWRDRALHLLGHDRDGCWVAEEGGRVVGAARSLRRETLWGLSSLAVDPDVRDRGVGRQLLEAALTYSQGCVRGIICCPLAPGAVRLFHQSGFRIHPTMRATGTIDRSTLPVVEGVRPGTAGDVDLLNSVDRQTRGAGHGADHEFMAGWHRLLVADNHLGSGYCYLALTGEIELLAATSERLAKRLVWEAMARSSGTEFWIGAATAEQSWLVDLAVRARLTIQPDAFLAVRFMRAPAPYIPSAHFL